MRTTAFSCLALILVLTVGCGGTTTNTAEADPDPAFEREAPRRTLSLYPLSDPQPVAPLQNWAQGPTNLVATQTYAPAGVAQPGVIQEPYSISEPYEVPAQTYAAAPSAGYSYGTASATYVPPATMYAAAPATEYSYSTSSVSYTPPVTTYAAAPASAYSAPATTYSATYTTTASGYATTSAVVPAGSATTTSLANAYSANYGTNPLAPASPYDNLPGYVPPQPAPPGTYTLGRGASYGSYTPPATATTTYATTTYAAAPAYTAPAPVAASYQASSYSPSLSATAPTYSGTTTASYTATTYTTAPTYSAPTVATYGAPTVQYTGSSYPAPIVSSTASPLPPVVSTTSVGAPAAGQYRLVPAPDVPPGNHPSDVAPSQWFEIVRPDNGPIRIGRVSSTCVCVGVRVPQRHVGAGERALIEVRTMTRPPRNNLVYGIYVSVMDPVSVMLDSDVTIRY